jgi:6-pyruvoyltetrahydropterin/6-carboxytetrahydropterin synthase
MITAIRVHEIPTGHRVYGHGGKCQFLHGHSYQFHLHCTTDTDNLNSLGMVIDFEDIKTLLCQWLDDNWSHRFLIWNKDPYALNLQALDPGVVIVPFNPTSENMAKYLVTCIAPIEFDGLGITLVSCTINESSHYSVTFTL